MSAGDVVEVGFTCVVELFKLLMHAPSSVNFYDLDQLGNQNHLWLE